MANTTVLALEGLSCGHCVASTRKALEAVAGAQQVDVTIDKAVITGEASSQSLIDAVENAGYQAKLQADDASPKSEPLTLPEMSLPERQSAATPSVPASNETTPAADDDSVQLLLSGMSCASCVSKVQQALERVDGVTRANVNLAERSALVRGAKNTQALIDAVEIRR
jgi:Cu+-exporting ATPase